MGLKSFFATGAAAPALEDRDAINRLYRRKRLSVMMGITLGYGFYYTCRLGLSLVKKPLIDEGIFTPQELGTIGSAIFYGYADGKLFNGFLADHANVRKGLSLALLLSALINLCMGSVSALWVWVILWGINGWVQGFGAPASVVALSHWFSNHERGRYYGMWSTAHSIGEGITFAGTSILVSYLGWRAGFSAPGLFCILVAIAIYFAVEDRPQTLGLPSVADWKSDHGEPLPKIDEHDLSTGRLQRKIFRMPSIWILGLSSACMYVTRYAINSWGVLYLQEAKGYSLVEAGGLMGLNTLAGVAGCVAYGFISDNLFRARRPPVTLIFGLLEVVSLLFIFFTPAQHTILLAAAFVLYGFTLSGILAALGGLFAVDIAPKRATGAVMGFIGVFSYLGASIQEHISGHLIAQGMTMVEGVRHYDFSKVILFWIGGSLLSLVLATSLWKAKARD